METKSDNPQHQETAREKLARLGFGPEREDKAHERGEFGLIMLGESCIIHLLEDDAVPEPGLSEYKGQEQGSFYLRRGRLRTVISRLRGTENKQ